MSYITRTIHLLFGLLNFVTFTIPQCSGTWYEIVLLILHIVVVDYFRGCFSQSLIYPIKFFLESRCIAQKTFFILVVTRCFFPALNSQEFFVYPFETTPTFFWIAMCGLTSVCSLLSPGTWYCNLRGTVPYRSSYGFRTETICLLIAIIPKSFLFHSVSAKSNHS